MDSLDKTNFSAFKFNEAACETVEQIGAPLMKNFGITHFGCIKILKNGLMLRISNNMLWNKKYFEAQFYNDFNMYGMQNVPENGSYVSFLTGTPKDAHSSSLCIEYNIWNFLFIYERIENEGYFWFFGTTRENDQIINFYINHLDIFKHFIFYFREKAKFLFDVSDKSKFIISKIRPFNDHLIHPGEIDNFIEQTKINKYIIWRDNLKSLQLSPREYECLENLLIGKTVKESAQNLKLSPRTIEAYLNNVKIKINVHTKSELIDFCKKYFLDIIH